MRITGPYNAVIPLLSAAVFLAIAAPSECSTDQTPRAQALRHHNTGVELARHGRLDEAIAEYDAGIALDPSISSLYYARAKAYTELRQFQPALTDLNKALELDPDKPQYYYERAVVYHALGDRARAEADVHSVLAVTSDPDYVYPAMNLLNRIVGGD